MSVGVDSFSGFVQKDFAHAAFATTAGMRDDEQVRLAARNMYECVPFPVNIAIKMSVGVEGLEHFALVFRDRLLAANINDITRVSPKVLRSLMQKSILSVPRLNQLVTTRGHEGLVEENFEPPVAALSMSQHDTPSSFVNGNTQSPAPEPDPDPDPEPAGCEPKAWYLCRDETQYGPWSDTEFLAFVEQGQLDLDDLIWREGFEDWISARELPEIMANRHGS